MVVLVPSQFCFYFHFYNQSATPSCFNDTFYPATFSAPPGFFIELVFMERFSVEESEDCTYDFIELRDGPFGYSKFVARFCGEGFPVSIQTESRYLWARFKTDDMVQYDGFKAVYEYKINESKCKNHIRKACPCNSYTLKPPLLYLSMQGYTIFSYFCSKT